MRRSIVFARAFVTTALLVLGILPVHAQQPARAARPDSARRPASAARPDSARRDTTKAEAGDSTTSRGLSGALSALLKPRLIGTAMTSGRISS
ncbi:MAG: hypothetical protein NTW72_07295, partial [Gemmatimonadetes bacterium]|nr:hypothetical protein [Gemmatimonadota bacterium]